MCNPLLETAELTFRYDRVGCKVEIKAPIKSLTIRSWNPTHKLSLKYPDSLINAEFGMRDVKNDFGRTEYHFQGEQKDEVFKLIKTVDRVKYLTLKCHTFTMIKARNIELPLFCNLIHLEVELTCKDLCVAVPSS